MHWSVQYFRLVTCQLSKKAKTRAMGMQSPEKELDGQLGKLIVGYATCERPVDFFMFLFMDIIYLYRYMIYIYIIIYIYIYLIIFMFHYGIIFIFIVFFIFSICLFEPRWGHDWTVLWADQAHSQGAAWNMLHSQFHCWCADGPWKAAAAEDQGLMLFVLQTIVLLEFNGQVWEWSTTAKLISINI